MCPNVLSAVFYVLKTYPMHCLWEVRPGTQELERLKYTCWIHKNLDGLFSAYDSKISAIKNVGDLIVFHSFIIDSKHLGWKGNFHRCSISSAKERVMFWKHHFYVIKQNSNRKSQFKNHLIQTSSSFHQSQESSAVSCPVLWLIEGGAIFGQMLFGFG